MTISATIEDGAACWRACQATLGFPKRTLLHRSIFSLSHVSLIVWRCVWVCVSFSFSTAHVIISDHREPVDHGQVQHNHSLVPWSRVLR